MLVKDQIPKPGTSLISGSNVNLYTEGNETRISQEVPNLKGMGYIEARNTLRACNLNIGIEGAGTVISQDPMAGTSVEEGTVVHVTLKQESQNIH